MEAKEENGKLRIQIKDDGVGFDVEEQKERIRDIRFTITFGTDEVEIKPQMQDIEAVEPFVVTDMNFEREAAE